jgi:hypothetical protein
MAPTATVTIGLTRHHPRPDVEPAAIAVALLESGAEVQTRVPTATMTDSGEVLVTFDFQRQARIPDDLVAQAIAAEAVGRIFRGLINLDVSVR